MSCGLVVLDLQLCLFQRLSRVLTDSYMGTAAMYASITSVPREWPTSFSVRQGRCGTNGSRTVTGITSSSPRQRHADVDVSVKVLNGAYSKVHCSINHRNDIHV